MLVSTLPRKSDDGGETSVAAEIMLDPRDVVKHILSLLLSCMNRMSLLLVAVASNSATALNGARYCCLPPARRRVRSRMLSSGGR